MTKRKNLWVYTLTLVCVLIFQSITVRAFPNFPKEIIASWYDQGKQTANGEKFFPDGLTAAHKTFPFNTMLRVSYKQKSIVVRINDRGPFIEGRSLDLARGAAKALGCGGVCKVKVTVLRWGTRNK